ncbi:glycosyltransferase [Nitrosomonas sp.]|uniref:glycosyltransferase family 2 protein n=1 Tax=Nitrosomonas sp. TaxID=42353 RepID=UPI0033066B3D
MNIGQPVVSLVIPTHNEGDDVLATVDCILRNSPREIQLIVVDDGSTDHSAARLQSLAEQGHIELHRGKRLGAIGARNTGAAMARAGIVGFIDAHCYTPKGWLEPLLEAFDRHADVAALSPVISCTRNLDARGYGATWIDDELAMHWLPFTAQMSDVPFIGGAGTFVRKKIFDSLDGFDAGIVQWGYEDVELSIRLWLFGHRVVVVPQSVIYHKFRTHFRYDLDFSEVLYNKLRLIFMHFDGHRLRRLLRHHLQYPSAEKGLARLYHDGSEARRDALLAARVQSMDSFCDRFQLVT